MVFLEAALESKFNPLVALGRAGRLSGFLNRFNGDAELLDDLVNILLRVYYTPDLFQEWSLDLKGSQSMSSIFSVKIWFPTWDQQERNQLVEQFQLRARSQRLRVTFLSGDVHCAAVGFFKTLKRGNGPEIASANDYRYMVNIVTSESSFTRTLAALADDPAKDPLS